MGQEIILRLFALVPSWNEEDELISRLRDAGHRVRSARGEDLEDLERALEEQQWDLIAFVEGVEDVQPQDVVRQVKAHGADVPVILVSRSLETESSLAALETGVRAVAPWEPESYWTRIVEREFSAILDRRGLGECRHALSESERRCRMLLDGSRDAVGYIHEGVHVYTNPAYLKLFGFSEPEDVIGIPLMDMVREDQQPTVRDFLRSHGRPGAAPGNLELEAVGTGGRAFRARLELMPASIDGEPCTQVLVHDLSVTEQVKQELRQMDPLTGLYNRQHLLTELERLTAGNVAGVGILYLELDDYTAVRAKIGLGGGDQVQKAIAGLLQEAVDGQGLLVRLADGAFIYVDEGRDTADWEALGEQVRRAIDEQIFDADGHSVTTSASVAIYPPDFPLDDSQAVLARLTLLCSRSREKGGNRVALYRPSAEDGGGQTRELLLRLREALDREQLRFKFQPIVSLHGEPGEYYEALLYLRGEDGQDTDPTELLLAARSEGMAAEVDRWVVEHAVAVIADERQRRKATGLFVPVSGAVFDDAEFVDWMADRLKDAGIEGEALTLQFSEADATSYLKKAIAFCGALAPLKCRLAVQVGSHESGMRHLRQLNADYFKIDESLIKGLATNKDQQDRVKALNEEIQELGKWTVAESVENANGLALLWQYGVNYVQGQALQAPSSDLGYNFSSDEM